MNEGKRNSTKKVTINKLPPGSPFGPILLISLGIILLLNNFNIISWNVWQILIKFWPVLLAVFGVEVLIGRSYLSWIIMFLISIVVIGFVILYSVSITDPKFDRWLTNNYSFWKNVKKILPYSVIKNQKLYCGPFGENCQLFFDKENRFYY